MFGFGCIFALSVIAPVFSSSLQIQARDNCFFTVKCFDDSVHHFKVSPKTDPEGIRKVSEQFLLPMLVPRQLLMSPTPDISTTQPHGVVKVIGGVK